MFGIGVPELILILVVGLIVFGPGKLPEMGRTLGKGLREFRRASKAQPSAQQPPAPSAQETTQPPAPATAESAAAAVAAHRAAQAEPPAGGEQKRE